MAPTSDNHKPISPTSGAGKGHKRLLWSCYGYFTAILQKIFKSGINKKNLNNDLNKHRTSTRLCLGFLLFTVLLPNYIQFPSLNI